MKRQHIIVGGLLALGALAVGMYVLNPFGVPTWDPRGRVLGVIPYRMPSDAMSPTLPRGNFVVACTAAYGGSEPAVGDIVVALMPPDFDAPRLERVIAAGGDAVAFEGSRFLRNGAVQAEAYVQAEPHYDTLQLTVPKGQVFLAGDNRDHSYDSRHVGPVPANQVIGKVCAGG